MSELCVVYTNMSNRDVDDDSNDNFLMTNFNVETRCVIAHFFSKNMFAIENQF